MSVKRRQAGLGRSERRLLRWVGLLATLLGLLFLLFVPGSGYLHYRGLKERVSELERSNAELEQRNQALAQEIKRLKTDDAYLEELAREKYGLLKRNETVYEFGNGKQ